MSLIATYINKFGIIHLSDSNLSSRDGNSGFGQKVFPIPYLNAALSYAGAYSINGTSIDFWMNNFITENFNETKNIEDFTILLARKMTSEMNEFEICIPTIVHIAGYSRNEHYSYAEFWHISNTTLTEGEYTEPIREFHPTNDFNTLKNKDQEEQLLKLESHSLHNIWFINGFSPGRSTYNYVKNNFDQILASIWSIEDWKFRQPNNIFESAEIIKLYFNTVIKLFTLSDYPAMYIGGDVQTYLIPVPPDLKKE